MFSRRRTCWTRSSDPQALGRSKLMMVAFAPVAQATHRERRGDGKVRLDHLKAPPVGRRRPGGTPPRQIVTATMVNLSQPASSFALGASCRRTTLGGDPLTPPASGWRTPAPVLDLGVAQAHQVEGVVLVQLPRRLASPAWGTSPWPAARSRRRSRARARGSMFGSSLRGVAWRGAGPAHVVEQPADVLAGQVALQRPRGVGVAERRGQVRHAVVHHALVGQRLAEVDRRAVDGELRSRPAPRSCRPGGGDDDVGVQLLAGLQPDAGLGERLDRVGDDRGACPALIASKRSASGTRHRRWSQGL